MSSGVMLGVLFRWVARVCSLLNACLAVAFAVGERGAPPTAQEWVGLAFFPIGVLIGIAIAWFREVPGSVVALASLALFYLWNWVVSRGWPGGPFFALLAAPGVLFLLAALLAPRR